MLKRTLFFASAVYLSTRHEQLVITYPDVKAVPKARRLKEEAPPREKTVPIEDIGVIVLEHPQITVTNQLMARLMEYKVAVIHCNGSHMPAAMLWPLRGHSQQSERFRHQINASVPLKKNLWKQTVQAKIRNQAALLEANGQDAERMWQWAREVKSGDRLNHEAQAALYYWPRIFPEIPDFIRHPEGEPPNNLLNYGYAVLRAIAARALVASGLLPTLGFFHRNKYNAFCLADDVMEPYRPYVDRMVAEVLRSGMPYEHLTPKLKTWLAALPALDVTINGRQSPLLIAMSRTTNALYECYAGVRKHILYPELR